jgi:hypothetical protein
MPSEMLITFLVMWGACTLLCLSLIGARYRYGVDRDALLALQSDGGER